MSRKKVSTTIYITPEQADRLKMLHDRTKVPIAVYICIAAAISLVSALVMRETRGTSLYALDEADRARGV